MLREKPRVTSVFCLTCASTSVSAATAVAAFRGLDPSSTSLRLCGRNSAKYLIIAKRTCLTNVTTKLSFICINHLVLHYILLQYHVCNHIFCWDRVYIWAISGSYEGVRRRCVCVYFDMLLYVADKT